MKLWRDLGLEKLGQHLGLRMFLVVVVNARNSGGGEWDIQDLTENEGHGEQVLRRKVAQNLIRFKSDMRCLLLW